MTFLSPTAVGQTIQCNFDGYKPVDGLHAGINRGILELIWKGEDGQTLQALFSIHDGHPVIQQLAARSGGAWDVLGKDLTPDFQVTTGRRRISSTQRNLLKKFDIDTPAEEDVRKWNTFWDAPLVVPGGCDTTDLPRKADEIQRAAVSYKSQSCHVTSTGARVSVTFDGLTLGLFSGDVEFTAYKGSNLLRQEAIAKTEQPSVAYIYKAGLKGFAIDDKTKLTWRDTARQWQAYAFGGSPNNEPINLRARNRLEILETGRGSLAVFPPPHKFFFARENEVNLGYVYYQKDNDHSFSLGAMQPERGEGYVPWGATDAIWKRRSEVSREEWDNFALYNAPPGTLQHMAVYYYLSAKDDRATQQAVLAYTHDDVFKPVPGFKVVTGHFHMDYNEVLRDRNTLDYQPGWVPVFRGLGINVVYLGDFHDDSDPNDPGPKRFAEEKIYFEGSRRMSDKDFLVVPAEEPNAYLGGHWYLMTPKPVYFSHATPRPANQQFMEDDPVYGHVYHLGSADDVLNMVNREQGILWTAHPRTKSSEGYPEAYKDKDFFLSDRFIGASWESLPTDLSEKRLCEVRCFGTTDDMSNWARKPKFMLAEGDTYTKWPEDETYPQLAVNYLKLDRVPLYNESWSPIVEGIRAGSFFGTTGEILFHNWGVEGTGAKAIYNAAIEYTFPLEFAELVWSDGTKVDRKVINLTGTAPFGTKNFKIPFDATGKKWVRFAVWDSAGNGAWVQPAAAPSHD
ncbi:MAG TPA: hypothetical protein VK604_01930 [Bryobacteraceae bacterium]|nr:hypothetical protein [Bryobacteraceae bacterium]